MELRAEKVVNNLPATLTKNTVYFVKVGAGFDIYVTNDSGTIVSYPLNTGIVGNYYIELNVYVPFPAKSRYVVNVVNASVVSTDFVNVELSPSLDGDENSKELFDIDFDAKCNTGSFDLTIFSKDQNVFGGLIKLLYKIN